ncbi:helix-turn-helix domain-containing protein [Natrinema sp. 1APR25-10V2]|uniref:ArsR/SmtB family transcription factor n=1 Tax=Natrinema sp. 1APR25-10V2 TaxID=2951081 RepID=UPI00287527D7|nr:helix-turn-helix domain-containing protein [Natrinema sp. 1APR25-10V2]MDS0477148.1 helix-turn-helix domain-containing protein [Natrinema sp. 1APR25-10V2]
MSELNAVLLALAHPLRREVVDHLRERDDETVTVAQLAEHLDDTQEGDSPATSALHHRHLPKLQAGGFLEYDIRSETIRRQQPTPRFDSLTTCVFEARDRGRDLTGGCGDTSQRE